ncbi:hypothetical protein [Flavobacterium sp. 22076]|uniref:hypothetical protein n=1 Tax=unclassified Flavobacterium TaxID=196869 RepID=UPI003F86D2ED
MGEIKHKPKKISDQYKTILLVNKLGIGISFWTIFIPYPYEYAIIISILFPIICIFVLKKTNFKINVEKHKDIPSITFGLFGVIFALAFRALIDFKILDYSNLWLPLIIIISISIAIVLRNQQFDLNKSVFSTAFFLLLFSSIYAYGTCISLNCIFDTSNPQIYSSTILKKNYYNISKANTYHLELTPWAKQQKTNKIIVSKTLYDIYEENDEVKIHQMKGRFDIPWFEITDKNTSK